MVLPCIVCNAEVSPSDARALPAVNTAKRKEYCAAWGIPLSSLPTSSTRRYICLTHFDDDVFETRGGQRVLKPDAYPKELNEDERTIMLDNIVYRYRQPKIPKSTSAAPLSNVKTLPPPSCSFEPSTSPLSNIEILPPPSCSFEPSTSPLSNIEILPPPSCSFEPSTSPLSNIEILPPPSCSFEPSTSPLSNIEILPPPSCSFEPSTSPLSNIEILSPPSCSFEPPTSMPEHDFEHPEVSDVEEIDDDHEKPTPKYVIVDLDNLGEYLKRCPKCGYQGKNAELSINFFGSALKSRIYCASCCSYVTWESQKRISGRKHYEGNVEIAAAMASTPIPLASFLQFCMILNLAMFSKTTFHRIIPTFWKAVSNSYFKMQQRVVDYLKDKVSRRIPINLCADGQYDSRGFSAMMCCVTVMDAVSHLIVTTLTLHKNNENCPSTSLECRGVEKALNEVLQKEIPIASLTTDRSKSVITLMQTTFPFIRHLYDAWHVIKGIAKLLRLECKNVRAKRFKEWCQALLNHLWFSVSAAKGDGKLCQQYVVSSLLHAMGVHGWPSGIMSSVLHDIQSLVLNVDSSDVLKYDPIDLPSKLIHQLQFDQHVTCGHEELFETDKEALDPNSKSYAVLQKMFTSDTFLNDVNNLSPEFATSALEGFHGLVSNKYRTKNSYYNKTGFENRTKLAVLHHNHNKFDEMEGKRVVTQEYQRKAKHRGGELVKKKRKSPTDYTWKVELIKETVASFVHKKDIVDDSDSESDFEECENDDREVDNLMVDSSEEESDSDDF